MYDAREKAIRDQQWMLNSVDRAYQKGLREGEIEGKIKGGIKGKVEGKIEGEIKLIRTLQGLLNVPVSADRDLCGLTLPQLEILTSNLQEKLRSRPSA
jgi:predicted transposase YdaD